MQIQRPIVPPHTTNVTKLCQFQGYPPNHKCYKIMPIPRTLDHQCSKIMPISRTLDHQCSKIMPIPRTLDHQCSKIMPISRPLPTSPMLKKTFNSEMICHTTNVLKSCRFHYDSNITKVCQFQDDSQHHQYIKL